LIGSMEYRYPLALREAQVKAPLAIAAGLFVVALLISFVAGFSLGLNRAEQVGSPELGRIDAVPSEDLPGEDIPGMKRYPGAVRVKYESHLLGEKRVSEVGYLTEGRVFDASRFYRQRLGEKGWSFEGQDFDGGELVLRARRGEEEVLVELEQKGELVEIEAELSEPISP
jgi:hypothetical protein